MISRRVFLKNGAFSLQNFATLVNDPTMLDPLITTFILATSTSLICCAVSVIVTSFNYAGYIETCLGSVAAQTYDEFECVIVDDASTDRSVDIIKRFIDQHPGGRFRLVRHGENQGQMAGFQTGLQHTRGRFVVFVDADDVLLPHFLETHVVAHLNGLYEAALTNSDELQIGRRLRRCLGVAGGRLRLDPFGHRRRPWRIGAGSRADRFGCPARLTPT